MIHSVSAGWWTSRSITRLGNHGAWQGLDRCWVAGTTGSCEASDCDQLHGACRLPQQHGLQDPRPTAGWLQASRARRAPLVLHAAAAAVVLEVPWCVTQAQPRAAWAARACLNQPKIILLAGVVAFAVDATCQEEYTTCDRAEAWQCWIMDINTQIYTDVP